MINRSYHLSTNLNIVNKNLLETAGQHVPSHSIATVTDVGHQILPLEATPDTVVNTLRFAPVPLNKETQIVYCQKNEIQTVLHFIKKKIITTLSLPYRSLWWRVNFFVRFLTMVLRNAGRIDILLLKHTKIASR